MLDDVEHAPDRLAELGDGIEDVGVFSAGWGARSSPHHQPGELRGFGPVTIGCHDLDGLEGRFHAGLEQAGDPSVTVHRLQNS